MYTLRLKCLDGPMPLDSWSQVTSFCGTCYPGSHPESDPGDECHGPWSVVDPCDGVVGSIVESEQ